MIISVSGEFYIFESDTFPTDEELKDFFQDLGENDILELRIESSPVVHANKFYLKNHLDLTNLALEKSADAFEKAARTYPYHVPVPILDQNGNCISIIKRVTTYYNHYYRYDGDFDLNFLDRYNCIALHGLNEYSVEIYRRVLPRWHGRSIYLIGSEWADFLDALPKLPNLQITMLDYIEGFPTAEFLSDNILTPIVNKDTAAPELPGNPDALHIIPGLPPNEDISRYEKGIMYYDEVMTLIFMFSYVIRPGTKNSGKKFFVIDGSYQLEGIYGIWHKAFTAARYALAKGYIPAFKIISSTANIYSDREDDDIWNKFFLQPEGYTIDDVLKSSYLALSPNMNLMNTMRFIMDAISKGYELSWPHGIFNDQVKQYINERKTCFLPDPEHTLGVLIRGTDYINTWLPGHARHATADMVIRKIDEITGVWALERIYLATEDSDILSEMKEYYGDRLTCTDQERYVVEPGQLLMDLHQTKKEGEGFRLGVEYICAVSLLAQCNSLIASGNCGAYDEALRENGGKYRHVYIFEL